MISFDVTNGPAITSGAAGGRTRWWAVGVLSLAIGMVGLDITVLNVALHPLVDPALFRDPGFTWGTVAAVVVSIGLFGVLFVIPQYLQAVAGHDALGTGLRLVPLMGGLLVAGALAPVLDRAAGTKITVAGGLAVVAAPRPDPARYARAGRRRRRHGPRIRDGRHRTRRPARRAGCAAPPGGLRRVRPGNDRRHALLRRDRPARRRPLPGVPACPSGGAGARAGEPVSR